MQHNINVDIDTPSKMKSIIILLFVVSLDSGACIMGPLTSTNKSLHAVGSAAIVLSVSKLSDDVNTGIALAIMAGTARELYKTRCEYSSIAYDLVGIYIGSKLDKRISIVGNKIVWTMDF